MSGALARVEHPADAPAWRAEARRLLAAGTRPERVVWEIGGESAGAAPDLFAGIATSEPGGRVGGAEPVSDPRVPAAFGALVDQVACHRDAHRFALLYRVLWRLTHGEPTLLGNRADPDVDAMERRAKAVRRDAHKMTAFVRFRRLPDGPDGPDGPDDPGGGIERYAAWFEPEHRICRYVADFFARRFANMRFAIFTPDESVHWDTHRIGFGRGGSRASVPSVEAMEDLWREYYANTFNPARLKLGAMRAEMPAKYWKNLPEASLIAGLAAGSGPRARAMVEAPATVPPRFARRAGLVDTGDDARPAVARDGNVGAGNVEAGNGGTGCPRPSAGNGNRVVREHESG